MELQPIFEQCRLSVDHYHSVAGGDINEAFCLYTKQGKFFFKFNSAALYPRMFEMEAAGLETLAKTAFLKVPTVVALGEASEHQFLLMEWLEKGVMSPGFWKSFGHGLAELHQQTGSYFGWHSDNFIGSLRQINTPSSTWAAFYGEWRLIPLAKRLYDTGAFSNDDIRLLEQVCKNLSLLFPEERPALLHGDLWSGNFMIEQSGVPAIFDPAVYFGHREMDLGMTRLFGGFDPLFYEAYNERFPLEKGWEKRVTLTQLYPLLVHAILFGGNYVESARQVIKNFA